MKKNYLSIILLSLLAISCSSPLMNGVPTGEMGLILDEGAMKSVISDVDTVPVSYRIDGSNAEGATFETITTDTNIRFPDLAAGVWHISVRAYNAADQIIAEGTGSLNVDAGGYTSMTVVLYSTTGTGSLDFSVSWNADLVYNETLEVSLKNLNGDVITLTLDQFTGSAAGLTENLSAGFYTMEVQLFDNMYLVMGAMEIIRIREGGETDIHLDFAQINKPGQSIPVSGDSFTMVWNYADAQPDYYNVYYREHGSFTWTFLGSTSSGTELEFTVDQSILAYGIYDFAVSSVGGTGESELHTSMDDSAVPATGWYIDWQEI